MRHYIIYIICFLSVFATNGANSIQFLRLGADLELSSQLINDIYQDTDGYLYFGTASGLDRFDGYSVRSFVCDPTDSTTIADSYVFSIRPMPDGRLWIDHNNMLFSIYDPSQERFVRVDADMCADMGLPGVPAIAHFDRDGHEWYYMPGDGLYMRSDGLTRKISDPDGVLRDSRLYDIIDESAGRVLLCLAGGSLASVDAATARLLSVIPPAEGAGAHAPCYAFADRDGMLWVFSDFGLRLYSPASGTWHDSVGGRPLPREKVKVVTQDSAGRIWIGFEHDGILVLGNNGESIHLTHSSTDSRSLAADNVTTIFEDRAGTIWVGSRKNGVSFYNASAFKFDFTGFPDVNAILGGRNGEVWLATDSDGIIRWDTRSGTSRNVSIPDDAGPDETMVTLALDSLGRVWAGSYTRGLVMVTPDGHSARRLTTADGLVSNSIWSILPRPGGSLLLGSLGDGLQLFNPDTGSSRIYNTSNSGLENDYIISMSEAPDGRVCIGTAHGLAIYDPATDSIVSHTGNRRSTSRFINQNINQVVADSRGLVWVATRSGLNVYDPAADSIYVVPTGGADRYVLGIAEDMAHAMWASIGGSLVRIAVSGGPADGSPLTFSTHTYDNSDGLQPCDFNQRSIAALPDGRMMIGGYYGVNSWRPDAIRTDGPSPRVFFTGLSLFNEDVPVGSKRDGRVPLPCRFSDLGGAISLIHSDKEFTVSFATDCYVNPSKTSYLYRLDGFNEEWQQLPPGTHRVTYTNLPPGSYRLHVRAMSGDGTPGSNDATLDITVRPPFYATTLARVLYALLAVLFALACLWLLHRRDVRVSRRRLEQDARLKQEELDQMKFRFFTNVSHELRTPLTLITAPLESLLKEPLDDRVHDKLKIIHNNAGKLLDMVNQLLDFRKNEMAGHSLSLSRGDVVAFVRGVCDDFRALSEKKNIHLTFFSSLNELVTDFDRDKLDKILNNLLSNAFKFTPDGGRVDVAMTPSPGDDMLEISIADTGCGISDADKQHVFERFFQTSDGPAMGGTGIGLSLVAEFVRLHGGTVAVSDNAVRGTVFTVSLPIVRSDASAEDANGSATAIPDPASPLSLIRPPRLSLLIVDDNAELQQFIKSELSNEYTVEQASDGTEALAKINIRKPDIIISDLMMDGMDGVELCRRLKSTPATTDIPLLILTAKHDVTDRIEGLTLGADDYVTKPFNVDELRLRLRKLLDLRGNGARRALVDPEPRSITITSLDERLIERAVRYVDDNMKRTDLSVEELATELGMSRVHLYKRLKQITGRTPIEFIRVLRLKRAAQMLRESQLNISEVAYSCGFNNPKYFSRYFRDEFGVLPSVYQVGIGG